MNYYKGSRIGTQILKFLGSTHVSGGTQRGVHGHMVAIWKGNPLLGILLLEATDGRKWHALGPSILPFVFLTTCSSTECAGLRVVKFARSSVVPPKTPQASKLPINLFPVD